MNSDAWQRLDALLDQALDLPESERDALLVQECGEDHQLLERARRLLMTSSDDFLDKPVLEHLREAVARQQDAIDQDLSQMPDYRIIEVLGQGGMGKVYLAHQESMGREVALKVISAGMEDLLGQARFTTEYRALARMHHEHIARVYEASFTPAGRPMFSMEYVPGLPLSQFLEKHQPDLQMRLDLFLQVCAGVAHAHARNVIHRDLKPSNILIAEEDHKALVIDFGIAKNLDEEQGQTRAGQVMGSLVYMAPEQADRREVDTRADIYALGAILYELLAGRPPFDPNQLASESQSGMLNILLNQTPQPPRGTIRKHPYPEMDDVALKALAKNPDERYETAAALADDVRACLEHRPVSAAPPSQWRKARMFVQRHRLAVGAVTAVIFALLLGTGLALLGLQRARTEQRIAEQARTETQIQSDRQQMVLDILENFLQSPNPWENDAGMTVGELLDNAEAHIEKSAKSDPLVRDYLLSIFANTWKSMSRLEEARELYLRLEQSVDPESEDAFEIKERLGSTYVELGEYKKAHAYFEEVIEGAGAGEVRELAMLNLADLLKLEGNYERSIGLHRELIEAEQHMPKPRKERLAILMRNMAYALGQTGESREGMAYATRSFELLGGDDPNMSDASYDPEQLRSLNTIAELETNASRALGLHQQIYQVRHEKLGPDHADTLVSLFNVGVAFYNGTQYSEALEAFAAVFELRSQTDEPNPPALRAQMYLEMSLDKLDEVDGLDALEDVLHTQMTLGAQGQLKTANNLANSLLKTDPERAAAILNEVIESWRGPQNIDFLICYLTLGEAYEALKRFDEAAFAYCYFLARAADTHQFYGYAKGRYDVILENFGLRQQN